MKEDFIYLCNMKEDFIYLCNMKEDFIYLCNMKEDFIYLCNMKEDFIYLCNMKEDFIYFCNMKEDFIYLCNMKEDCSKEQSICRASRDLISTQNFVSRVDTSKVLGYCLPGLQNYAIFSTLHCTMQDGNFTTDTTFGLNPEKVVFPVNNTDMNSNIYIQCGHSYGELNVYLTCAGLCGSDSIQCPLQHPKGDDCLNMKKRVITITSDNALAVVYPHNGSFHGDIFACSNKRCVTYEKVCNLVDKVCNLVDKVCNLVEDCVASSDEENCYNHFE